MRVTIVGSGDAFGSGGRGHTCFHVGSTAGNFLIDFGASAGIGMRRCGLSLDAVDAIFISHLHGDHFGGLPFAILDAMFITRRTKALTIFGPPTIGERTQSLCEAMFPGTFALKKQFELVFKEMSAGTATRWGDVVARAFEVVHPSGAPSHALRFALEDKTLAFSGDTQWCENLLKAGSGADLFITECHSFDRDVPFHLKWVDLKNELARIAARQVVLTHLSDPMLAKADEIAKQGVTISHDGMVLDV